jgi:hypothetical protein
MLHLYNCNIVEPLGYKFSYLIGVPINNYDSVIPIQLSMGKIYQMTI